MQFRVGGPPGPGGPPTRISIFSAFSAAIVVVLVSCEIIQALRQRLHDRHNAGREERRKAAIDSKLAEKDKVAQSLQEQLQAQTASHQDQIQNLKTSHQEQIDAMSTNHQEKINLIAKLEENCQELSAVKEAFRKEEAVRRISETRQRQAEDAQAREYRVNKELRAQIEEMRRSSTRR